MATLDYWSLRRHCRELAVRVAHRPTVLRVCEFGQGDWGFILREADGARTLLHARVQPQHAGLLWQTVWDDPVVEPHGFGASLDRRLRDARLVSLAVAGWDRVVVLDFLRVDSVLGGKTRFRLILELTGRVTNALVLDADGTVLDQWNHRTHNGIKKTYVAPPGAPDRLDPLTASPTAVSEILRAPPEAWPDRIHGMTPRLARELAHRLQHQQMPAAETWAALIDELVGAGSVWVYTANAKVQAIAALALTHLGSSATAHASVNDALLVIERDFTGVRDLAGLRERALQRWRKEIGRVETALAEEEARLASYRRADDLRQAGELILAYLNQIPPRAALVELPGFTDGQPVNVTLDPLRSPADNAKQYFNRYKKARRGLAAAQQRIDVLRGELAWLREQEYLCVSAERAGDLEAMLRTETTVRQRRGRRTEQAVVGDRKHAKALPPLLELDGCRFYVGRNARHNDLITFHLGRRGDIWLHAHEVPGSHVLVRRPGATPCEEDVLRGAILAAWFSAARQGSNVVVDATDVATVRRIPGGGAGRVSFKPQQSLRVDPWQAEALLAQGTPSPDDR